MRSDEPLRAHWNSFVSNRASSLENILKSATKNGANFKNISQAAQYGASKLSENNPSQPPVNRSTLTRNRTYNLILAQFVTGKTSIDPTPSERVKYELELRARRKEIEALERHLATVIEDRSKMEHRISRSHNHDSSEVAEIQSFKIWKRIMYVIFQQLEGAHFDCLKRTVEDPNGVGTLLEERDFPEGFFNWLDRNE